MNILRGVPIRQGDEGWNCIGWIKDTLSAILEDDKAVGTSLLGWVRVRDGAMGFIVVIRLMVIALMSTGGLLYLLCRAYLSSDTGYGDHSVGWCISKVADKAGYFLSISMFVSMFLICHIDETGGGSIHSWTEPVWLLE
jgi:hypothetical protein